MMDSNQLKEMIVPGFVLILVFQVLIEFMFNIALLCSIRVLYLISRFLNSILERDFLNFYKSILTPLNLNHYRLKFQILMCHGMWHFKKGEELLNHFTANFLPNESTELNTLIDVFSDSKITYIHDKFNC